MNIEVGIQDHVNFNFEIFQNKFSLQDCIIGRIKFNLVKIQLKGAELHLYKKEILLGIFLS